MQNWIIRQPKESDNKYFRQTFDVIAKEEKYFSFTTAPSKESLQKYRSRVISQKTPFLVLEINGEFAGWPETSPLHGQSTKHNALLSIAILLDFRGKKLGPTLAQRIVGEVGEAESYGFHYLGADVFSENTRAIHLYKNLCFKIDGKRKDFVRFGCQQMSLTFLTLNLKNK